MKTTKINSTFKFFIFFFIIGLIILFSCQTKSNQSNNISIFTSVEPIKFLIDNITGGDIYVDTLVKPGVDPHTFEISAKQLADIVKSKAYFSIDFPFEITLTEKIKKQNKNFKIYKLYINEDQVEDAHVWLSISKIKDITEKILQSLVELYPDKKDIFQENYNILLNKLDQIDEAIRFNIENSGFKAFLIFHPALTYFAQDYGLTQIAIEHEGKIPTGQHLAEIDKEIKVNKISFILVQPEFPVEQISQFIKDNNLKVYSVNLLNYNVLDTLLKISEIFIQNKVER